MCVSITKLVLTFYQKKALFTSQYKNTFTFTKAAYFFYKNGVHFF